MFDPPNTPIVYIAGKYADKNWWAVDQNIRKARKVAIQLLEAGIYYICPHLNTFHFGDDCKCTRPDYMRLDLTILSRCNALLLLDNWQDSKGARTEHGFARKHNIPIFESIEEVQKHFNHREGVL